MNIKSIIAALAVAGSSSVALAHPVSPCDQPAPVSTPVYIRPIYSKPAQPRPVTLGVENRAWRGTETFWVGANQGKFQTLKLEGTGFNSFVKSVKIRFANGREQTVALGERITASNPCVTIDLDGRDPRAIASVTIAGSNARNSQLRIVAV